jgi:hypothetical protein
VVDLDCLDWLLILNQRHLEHVLRIFVQHCGPGSGAARATTP